MVRANTSHSWRPLTTGVPGETPDDLVGACELVSVSCGLLLDNVMGALRYSASMSLDGFVAGRDQSVDRPLGVGGERLHEWMRELAVWRTQAGAGQDGVENASTSVLEREDENVGAIIMGRNMFGGGPGPWTDEPWNGWWGDDPPFHLPVFVLTSHARELLVMEGGTTFAFVTDGVDRALELAMDAAGGRDVALSGGGSTARQFIARGLVDQVTIHLAPVLLGQGVQLFDGTPLSTRFVQTDVVPAPGVTHITYRCVPDS
jgi:dihydrofolate reductase